MHSTETIQGEREHSLIHAPEGRSWSHWQHCVDESAWKNMDCRFFCALLPPAQQTPVSEAVIIFGKV